MMKAKGRRHPDVDADDQQGSEEHHFLKQWGSSVVGDTTAGIDDRVVLTSRNSRGDGKTKSGLSLSLSLLAVIVPQW